MHVVIPGSRRGAGGGLHESREAVAARRPRRSPLTGKATLDTREFNQQRMLPLKRPDFLGAASMNQNNLLLIHGDCVESYASADRVYGASHTLLLPVGDS